MSTRVPEWTEKSGEALDRVAMLHQGRDRVLWRVRDRRDGHTEVLKLAPPEAPDEARRALAEEFLLLERIRHPHWVRPLGFVHLEDGSCGYRMEDGGTAVSVGAGEGWLPRDLASVRELLGALACLHAIGFVHLDIKPSQLLQGPTGVKLIDPGLAAREGSALPVRGTWGFIAPEILRGAAWDRRADFYALGCVLVEIWTGENPLGDGEIAEQIRRQRNRPRLRLREKVPEIPEGLDHVVETLLDSDKERRPRNAREVWSSLHTMAAYREGYAESRRLPPPDDLPHVGAEETEAAWDRALRGDGPPRWVISGPIGTGRRRMIERLRAMAEVAGFSCETQPDTLVALGSARPGGRPNAIHCRIGKPLPGEQRIELGSVGAGAAAAALEAYGLDAEGGEASWTRGLLRLRLQERLGAETERRRSARSRRTMATTVSAALGDPDRARLASLLAREPDDPPIPGIPEEPLVTRGLAKVDSSGTLQPACPPWDEASLAVVAGDGPLMTAHRRMLADARPRPVAAAVHALRCGDAEETLATVPAAMRSLRESGNLGRAFDLVAAARDLLGARFPAAWAMEQASVALDDGAPARVLALLGPGGVDLPDAWRMLLEAQLQYRSGRRREAIASARAAQERTAERRILRAAELIVIRSQRLLGETAEAEAGARRLMNEASPDSPLVDRLRPAALLLSILSGRGESERDRASIRDLCSRNLTTLGTRERHEIASALGSEAFHRGDFSAAGTFMEIAVHAAAACQDPVSLAIGQMNLAGVYFEEGRTAESEELNRKALISCRVAGMELQAAHAERNLATVMLATGRFGEALRICRKARGGLGDDLQSPTVLAAVAVECEILLEAGLLEAARTSLTTASDLLAIHPVPTVGTVIWRDMGRLERWTGRLQEAAERFDEARRQAHEAGALDDDARTLIELAALRIASEDRSEASDMLEEADAIVRASSSVELALRLDFVRAMRICDENPHAAREILALATERASRGHLAGWVWRCHAADAGLARALGDREGTLRAMASARHSLLDLLEAIGPEAMRESYVMLCDTRLFLAWCEDETAMLEELPRGSSDLEVFLR